MTKNYCIKIPEETTILYSKNKTFITIISPLVTKSIKLNVKVKLVKSKKWVIVAPQLWTSTKAIKEKELKILQGTTYALIKKALSESTVKLFKTIKLVGIGYRAFEVNSFKNQLLMFKLGHSHPIYFKLPKNLSFLCLKFTNLFIFGTSHQNISDSAARFRSAKPPEPYKGKGILYNEEKITLKEGKKV